MDKRHAHGRFDDFYWDTLDNAAKIIPAVSDSRSSNVFRLSVVLKEEVDPELLQQALERAITVFPAFAVNLRRGLFWYYLDANPSIPRVREETNYPCAPIRSGDNDFLFRVIYYKKRINLEVFHVLSDGMGAMQFLHVLLCYYFNLRENGLIPEEEIRGYCDRVARDYDEDSFARNVEKHLSTEKKSTEKVKETDAFRIGCYHYEESRLGVLSVLVPTDKILELAHESNSTMSQYLTALLIWGICNTSYRRSGSSRPITISLPVNLRSMFGSTTARNFFGHVNIGVKPGRNPSFETILDEVKKFFEEKITREYFERQMADNVAIERITPIRFVPIWIKDLVMRIIFSNAAKRYTITLSNLGRIKLPSQIENKVDHFDIILGGSRTHPKKTGVGSYGNTLSLTFSSTVFDNSLERFIVKFLSERGIEPTLISNETPPPEKKKLTKKEKSAKSKGDDV